MGFLNSPALWLGLAGAGILVPIIIHLLYRKHRRQTPWAAMELLRRALVVRSGQLKMEDFFILFLRCLAILLVALALLRPTFNVESVAWLGEKRVGMVVGVDASYSMGHGRHSRFERARASAKTILGTAREGNPVSLILMSNRPEIVLRRTGYSPTAVAEALDTPRGAHAPIDSISSATSRSSRSLFASSRRRRGSATSLPMPRSVIGLLSLRRLARALRISPAKQTVFVVPVATDRRGELEPEAARLLVGVP